MIIERMHVSIERFVLHMADGWRLPFIVTPTLGHHGNYSITMWRPVDVDAHHL